MRRGDQTLSFAFAIGKGKARTSEEAAQQAVDTCRREQAGANPDLLMVFASRVYNHTVILDRIRKEFPDTPMLGCTTAGEIYSNGPDEESVALLAMSGLHAEVAVGGTLSRDSYGAGKILAQEFSSAPGDLIFILSDGLAGDGAAVLQGVRDHLAVKLPLIGAAAADDGQFRNTLQFCGTRVLSDTLVAAKVRGEFHFGVGVRHGWEPVGLPVRVTRSRGNRLCEINDLPAIQLYDEYFGEYCQRMRNEPMARLAVYYPLGLPVPESDEFLLRAPIAVEKDGSIKFTAELPTGADVRLMIGNVESAMRAARIAAMEALSQMRGRTPKLAILFDGMARRRVFGLRAGQEIKLVRDIIGPEVPVVGFYAYGEIAPLEGTDPSASCFHNETLVILTLG